MRKLLFLGLLTVSLLWAGELTSTGFIYPLKGGLSVLRHGDFGTSFSEGYGHPGKWHCGVDWAAPVGTPVYAVADGVVMKISHLGWSENEDSETARTNFAYLIEHRLADGKSFFAVYGHLKRPWELEAGQRVKAGQLIGFVGPWKKAPHLHFAIFMAEDGRGDYPESAYGMQPLPRPEKRLIAGVTAYPSVKEAEVHPGFWFDPGEFLRRRFPGQ